MESTKKIEECKAYNTHCFTIGDLVEIKLTGEIIRINGIKNGLIYYSSDKSVSISEVRPIWLTTDILERNDFKKKGLTYVNGDYADFMIDAMPWGGDLFCLTITTKKDSPFQVCVFVRSVSKLQEVLRACRFVSLADTFVV